MDKRIQWIDSAKGLLMILVILGHCHMSEKGDYVINSFHMAAFFAISGYTYKPTADIKMFVTRKVRSLIIPYLNFAFIMLVYQYIRCLALQVGPFSWSEALVCVAFPVSGRAGPTVYGLWFLPSLFLVELLVQCLHTLENRGGVYGTAFLGCLIVVWKCTGVACILTTLPIAVVDFFFGILLRKCDVTQKFKSCWKTIFACALCFTISTSLNYFWGGHTVDLSSMTLGIIPLYLISGLTGTVLVFFIAKIIEPIKPILFIGKKSIYFYGLHYEALGLVEHIVPAKGVAFLFVMVLLYPIVIVYNKIEKIFVRGKND